MLILGSLKSREWEGYGDTDSEMWTCVLVTSCPQIKIQEVRSFKSSEHIRKEVDGPYFEVSAKKSLISDPAMTLQRKPEENMLQVCEFQISSRFKD